MSADRRAADTPAWGKTRLSARLAAVCLVLAWLPLQLNAQQGVLGGAAAGSIFGPVGTLIGGILGFLGGLFSLFGDSTGAIKQAIGILSGWTSELARKVTQWLQIVTEGGLLGILKRIADTVKKLKEKLDDFFTPLIQALKRLRSWLDLIYQRIIVPLLNILQHIRQVLLIFRLLHLKWAEKLDAYLVHLEVLINRPVAILRAAVNGILTVLEEVIDPLGTITGGAFLWSAWRYLGQLHALLHLGQLIGLKPGAAKILDTYKGFLSDPAIAARVPLYKRPTLPAPLDGLQAQIRAQVAELRAGKEETV